MKIAGVSAVALALCGTVEGFTAHSVKSTSTSLNGYRFVKDSEAYVASYHQQDPSGVRHYGYRKEDHVPGTTGGTGGSTLVSDFIVKDSVYGPNYHYVQGYRRNRFVPKSEPKSEPQQEQLGIPSTPQLRQPWNKDKGDTSYSASFPQEAKKAQAAVAK